MPALMSEQFDENGKAWVELPFADKRFRIVIENPQKLQYGDYHIQSAVMGGRALTLKEEADKDGKLSVRAVLERSEIGQLSEGVHQIEVLLKA